MRIILVPDNNGKRQNTCLSSVQVKFLFLLLFVLIPGLLGWGFVSAFSQYQNYQQPLVTAENFQKLERQLALERERIAQIRFGSEKNLDYLGLEVGRIYAQVARVNALGKRLSKMADLDDGEFDFSVVPALGGDIPQLDTGEPNYYELIGSLAQLENRLETYSDQLSIMEALMVDRDLDYAQYPKGKPVNKGWVSSAFGKRRDPFTGRTAFHRGIDIASKSGEPIRVVADGIVSRVQFRSGYGLMVEVNHGNGYVTRYAHALSALVENGAKVSRGQEIAVVGSTGRSTGPHVHFEVLLNGKNLNPRKYLKSSG